VNYIEEGEKMCKTCIEEMEPQVKETDDPDSNKYLVEKYLLPVLRSVKPIALEMFMTKDESFNFLKLRMPLLVKCE